MSSQVWTPGRYSALRYVQDRVGHFQELWNLFGFRWSSDLAVNGQKAQRILGGDHGELNPTFAARLADSPELQGYFKYTLGRIDMFEGSDFPEIPAGVPSELVLTAGKYTSMQRQMAPIVAGLVSGEIKFDEVYYLTGVRPRTDWQDGTYEQIVAGLTSPASGHWWIQRELERQDADIPDGYEGAVEKFPRWGGAFDTEAKLVILTLILVAGESIESLRLSPITDDGDDTLAIEEGQRRREFMSCTITLSNGQQIIVINAPAVEREMGPARPTSKSTNEYRTLHWPPAPGVHMVTRALPVHGQRVTGTLEREIHLTRPDITVYGTWDAADPNTRLNQAIGEAIRLMVNAGHELALIEQSEDQ